MHVVPFLNSLLNALNCLCMFLLWIGGLKSPPVLMVAVCGCLRLGSGPFLWLLFSCLVSFCRRGKSISDREMCISSLRLVVCLCLCHPFLFVFVQVTGSERVSVLVSVYFILCKDRACERYRPHSTKKKNLENLSGANFAFWGRRKRAFVPQCC